MLDSILMFDVLVSLDLFLDIMWSFPISNGVDSSSDDGGNGKVTVAKQVEPSACDLRCQIEQKELVSCVDSIRAAKASSSDDTAASNSEKSTSSPGDNNAEESSAETPACLPLAIAAWTKCCTDANDLQLEQQQKEDEEEKKEDPS